MKLCPRCETQKSGTEFYRRSGSESLHSYCKSCTGRCARISESKKDPTEKRKASVERSRNWAHRHPQKIRFMRRRLYEADSEVRIKTVARSRVRDALLKLKSSKSASTSALLGCPAVWLSIHLGSLFTAGMTWDNYATVWEIDHIKPCAAFDLTDPKQQKACFHWTNLQPLFLSDNRRKGDNYAPPRQPSKEVGSACCRPPSF